MNVPESSPLDAVADTLKVGLKELAIFARENRWTLRNREVVMHRAWTDGAPTASYQEEMVLNWGAIGWCSDYLKQNISDSITTILQSNENLAITLATSDYKSDVAETLRNAAASDALIDDFVVAYLHDSENIDWNERAFEESMSSLRQFARSTTHSLVVRAPLLGFSMCADDLTVANGLFVRHLEREEYLKLESSNLYERHNRSISPFQWTPGRFVLQLEVGVPIGAD